MTKRKHVPRFLFTAGTGTAGRHSNLAQGLVKRLVDSACARACEQWSEMKTLLKAAAFPDIATIIREELNHE